MKGKEAGKPRLRCRVTAVAETIIRGGHPWVFADSVREQNRDGEPGELAVIYDRNDCFLAVGLFDPESPLRIRVLQAGKPLTIDDAWWQTRWNDARQLRRGLLDERTAACRLSNGESDGWPGLVVDRYGPVLVLKLYTAAWLARLPYLITLLQDSEHPQTIVLRLSRNVQPHFAKAGFKDGQIVYGEAIERPVIFRESGIQFEADVISGQKTGFFLDQRENRRAVEELARDGDMLNAFSFSGGFSLYAARGGAGSVTNLDISEYALAGARRNFQLNRDVPLIARCRHETIQANAFDWLRENKERLFHMIVLDPPSLAKREAEREGAIRAYRTLVSAALEHLRSGGVLAAASCSAHVSADEFFDAVKQAAKEGGRKFEVIKTNRHAVDHPATFREAEYLKCIFVRLPR
jgi:23S rRNA (cytosine1962-C5)-methyltransferase